MGISKFKKEHDEIMKQMQEGEIRFATNHEDIEKNGAELKVRKLGPIGWELVWRYRLKELEDREQKWKKQNKQIKSLKHQLAEKDEELAELKDILEYIEEGNNGVVQVFDITGHDKEIRHQVCEEIRKKAQCFNNNWRIIEIIDQIEQGESK